MKWFDGSVQDAVNEAKQRNSLFVVYVEGSDRSSEVMTTALNCKEIFRILESERYVSIRIKAESEEYSHFVNIYKHVPVPSFFLIGLNGVPIAVVYNFNDNIESLRNEILRVLYLNEDGTFKENNLKRIQKENKPDDTIFNETTSETSEADDFDKDDKASVDILLPEELPTLESSNCLAQKSLLLCKKKDDDRKSKNNNNIEINKSVPQNMSRPESKGKNQSNEMNKSKSQNRHQLENSENARLQEIQQERIRNERDRQRILNDIAIDKQERVIRQQNTNVLPQSSVSNSLPGTSETEAPIVTAYQTRIQFRKPDGSTCTAVFNSASVINDLRLYVIQNMNINSRRFKLATAFPRHIFTDEENNKSLDELGLVPNAVIIIIPMSEDRTPATYVFSQVSDTFWYLASPVMSLFHMIQNSIYGTPQITQGVLRRSSPESSSRQNNSSRNKNSPNQANSAGHGNLHTFANINNNRKDDDKNNVWNGNSTQQSQ